MWTYLWKGIIIHFTTLSWNKWTQSRNLLQMRFKINLIFLWNIENLVHDSFTHDEFHSSGQQSGLFWGYVPLGYPDQDQWSEITRIMVDQMSRWIHSGQGLIYHDPNDLGSLIVIRIISKKRTLGLKNWTMKQCMQKLLSKKWTDLS